MEFVNCDVRLVIWDNIIFLCHLLLPQRFSSGICFYSFFVAWSKDQYFSRVRAPRNRYKNTQNKNWSGCILSLQGNDSCLWNLFLIIPLSTLLMIFGMNIEMHFDICNKSEFVDSLVILLINSILDTQYTLPAMYIECQHNDDQYYH